MLDWKKISYEIGNDVETKLDFYKLKLREKLGWNLPVQITPYITYGNSENIYLRGRVMYDRSIISDDKDSLFENLLNMYKRIASVEIAGAQLKVAFSNTEFIFTTDEDGYFEFPFRLNTTLPKEQLWHSPLLELIDCTVKFQKPLFRHGLVMTPPVTAQFGIISDVDDTIIPTNADSLLKMAIATFTKNQFTRFPFEGVPEFYNALHKGISGENFNPFFYVSSSPWNLYDLLLDFFKINTPSELYVSIVHPDIEVNTKDARHILRNEVSMNKAISQMGNVAGMVAGLIGEDFDLIGRSCTRNTTT